MSSSDGTSAASSSSATTNKSTTKNATTAMGYFWKTREMLTPTLKHTAFLTKGILTPEEFVRAGDELVYRCPTWSWCSGGIGPKSYLPPDKQYLITRNVPCRDRVATLEQSTIDMLLHEQSGGDDDMMDDWMVSSLPNRTNDHNLDDDFDVIDEDGEVITTTSSLSRNVRPSDVAIEQEQQQQQDDEYADMADFEDHDVMIDDDCAAIHYDKDTTNIGNNNHHNESSNIIRVRTYDLSITYDNYYRTPRIWMTGKSMTGNPLTAKETMEDVITDYANKTVTMEAHPHLSGPHASIHPCKHGAVMKTIVRNLISMTNNNNNGTTDGEEGNNGPAVEMYLFIFLKFVSSIIPTINYDFTMDVTANTSK